MGALALTLGACAATEAEPVVAAATAPVTAPSDPTELTFPDGTTPPHPPFGFWGLNGYVTPNGLADVKQRMGITVFHHATRFPELGVDELLPKVRAAGLRVTLRLTGDHQHYTNADGDFDLASWKAMLAPWKDSGVLEFVRDGTLAGHMLLDDIENFEGRDPDAADLEEMGRYSEEIIPGLMTFVRHRATGLPTPEGGRYRFVDAVVNQYLAERGDVETYARAEASRATELDLVVINGLNIADGGDGSSGQRGWRKNKWAMTPEEVERYGTVLANVPECAMFLLWEYDAEETWSDGSIGATHFDAPSYQAAFSSVGSALSAREGRPLQTR